jgi:hypothetical protein
MAASRSQSDASGSGQIPPAVEPVADHRPQSPAGATNVPAEGGINWRRYLMPALIAAFVGCLVVATVWPKAPRRQPISTEGSTCVISGPLMYEDAEGRVWTVPPRTSFTEFAAQREAEANARKTVTPPSDEDADQARGDVK